MRAALGAAMQTPALHSRGDAHTRAVCPRKTTAIPTPNKTSAIPASPTKTAALFVLIAASACTKTTTVSSREASSVNTRGVVDVVLTDGTKTSLLGMRVEIEEVCGRPVRCEGPSCGGSSGAGAGDRACFSKDKIVSLSASEIDAKAVAGITLAAVAAAAITVALVESSRPHTQPTAGTSPPPPSSPTSHNMGSCPRIYSWNGSEWQLDSGTFGLAYFKAAPRTDFDVLDALVADRGTYRFKLVNEQDETEHTDLVRLKVIDHPTGTRVVPSEDGRLHTFRDEALPLSAQDFRGVDARELIRTKDDREWSSDFSARDPNRMQDARDGLRLVFAKPQDAAVAKLRIGAHNTVWAGQMLGFLLAHRGDELPAWLAKMNHDDKARAGLDAFLVREGMLDVRVKTAAGWSSRGTFWAAGSEIVKEEAFEIALADVPGGTIEVELESATGFWSIDNVSISYGADEPIAIRDLAPKAARTNDGRDVAAVLGTKDGQMFDTVRGDVAELVFDVPPPPKRRDTKRSFIVETHGYYVPEIAPAADADPAAMDLVMSMPYAASRLALALRLGAADAKGAQK